MFKPIRQGQWEEISRKNHSAESDFWKMFFASITETIKSTVNTSVKKIVKRFRRYGKLSPEEDQRGKGVGII
jgi:hypothetical protein